MSLPALVVFSVSDSNNEVRYLSFTGPQRQLRCGIEEGVHSDTTKFAVESTGDGLVHIRSCFDNYYWSRASRFDPWLLASSREKVEDMSNDRCTLFRPRMSAGNVFVGFVHVQSGLNVVMRPPTDAHAYNLCVEHAVSTDFSYLDYAPLIPFKLPRYIMFLGDNNSYLSTSAQRPLAILQFGRYFSPTSRDVGFEIVYTKSGALRIKSMTLNEFWDAKPPSQVVVIDTDTQSDPNNPNTLFDVAFSTVQSNREVGVALRCRGYDRYVQRALRNDCVVASNSPNLISAWLRPRIPLIQGKRRVNIESFRHAWVAPKTTQRLRERSFPNTTREEFQSPVYTETHTEYTGTTFINSIGSFSVPMAIYNGRMPRVLATGELEIPDETTEVSANWGTTRKMWQGGRRHNYSVLVPPMSTVTLTLFQKIITYEVPFSYQQIDEAPFGGMITQDLYDGVFKITAERGIEEETSIQYFTSSEVLEGKICTEEKNILYDKRVYDDEQGNIEPDASDQSGYDEEGSIIGPDASEKEAEIEQPNVAHQVEQESLEMKE